jgi:predicted fused transcriptional regulator/phosphomethylpyrimidine kinase
VVSGRLYVVKGLKRADQIVSFGRSRHLIGL